MLALVWVAVLAAIFLFSWLTYLRLTLPDPETLGSRQIKESAKIYDRTGEVVLYDIYKEEQRTVLELDQIPQSAKDAVIAAEDANFYQHKGLDLKGIFRAVLRDIQTSSKSQGGSTITQQLVKNALLGKEKTWSRKIRELMLAVEIERQFPKDQILGMYLNQIPYGSTLYGIEAASRAFFDKSATQLSVAESATLAALQNAPTRLSPFGQHVDELLSRKDMVLGRMRELDLLTQEAYEQALAEDITFTHGVERVMAPHFVLMVKDYLVTKYGEDMVAAGGLRVITTLDANLQKTAEELVAKYVAVNREKYKAENAALVAIDPRTGDLLAMVGSADYFDVEHEGNFNVATALRQPGSAFKPFAYAAAFMAGFPDTTTVFDVRTEFNPYCSPDGSQKTDQYGLECYHPQNYDGRFRGPVTLRQSLAQSLNIPSVKVLDLAGVSATIDLAKKMGITSLDDTSRFGLSLVLGGAEVRLVDLVSAYGVFANDGVRAPWSFIQRVESRGNEVLEEREGSVARVVPESAARLVTSILSDNAARAPVFGFSSPLFIPGREVAVKTGTTQKNRDAWTVGYTPSLAVGIWVGNNHNASMTQAGAGISAAGPLWHEFMVRALSQIPQEHFQAPDPTSTDKIMLNGNYIYYPNTSASPEMHTILYYVDPERPQNSSFPEHPEENPQFKNWEWAVQHFLTAGL